MLRIASVEMTMEALILEVQNRKILIIELGGSIIRFCGVGFVFEIAEVLSFSVDADRCPPLVGTFPIVPDASVFGGGVDFGIACVAGVFGGSGGAEVGLAIV